MMNKEEALELLSDPSNFSRSYRGKAGRCCCGCSGTHKTRAADAEAVGLRCGYALDADDISDRSVTRVVNDIRRALKADRGDFLLHDDLLSVDTPEGRRLIAYLRDAG